MKTINKISKVVALALSLTGTISTVSYADPGNMEAINSASDDFRNIIGIEISTATDIQKVAAGCKEDGAFISAIIPKLPAEIAGLKAGDVIVSINGNRVKDHTDALSIMTDLEAGREYPFQVYRKGVQLTFKVLVKKVQEKAIGKIS